MPLEQPEKEGRVFVIDTRDDGGHVPGALHIAPDDKFSTYAAWFVNYGAPTYLIAASENVDRLVCNLRAVGVDTLPGYFAPTEVGDLNAELPTILPDEAARRIEQGAFVLDVRSQSEYDEEHVAGATHIHYGALPQRLAALPRDRLIVIYCASGVRSQIAASLLIKHGFEAFASIKGGLSAWKQAGFPVTTAESVWQRQAARD